MQYPELIDDSPNRAIVYSVSQLNREANHLLSAHFPVVLVEGEISNLARPSSGHIYFTLKDEDAQVRCAMFRSRHQRLDFKPENGVQVIVRAKIGLFESRGDFQLIIERMEDAGAGALRRAFEALKNRLSTEGLFDPAHKKPVPSLPKKIGIITSPTGAALQDILTILRRRFSAIQALIYPVSVQGESASHEIVEMIQQAQQRNECDVLILARGGGSLEDLWAFNEETVARAIYHCKLPVVTGIGHEIDFTIADFVADLRAATPSAAAESISPDISELLEKIQQHEHHLFQWLTRSLKQNQQELEWLTKRLDQQRPDRKLLDQYQRLDELDVRITRAIANRLDKLTARMREYHARVRQHNPIHRISALSSHNDVIRKRLAKTVTNQLNMHRLTLNSLVHALDNVSPLATLDRGYAIVIREQDKKIVQSYKQITKGDKVQAKLAEGSLECIVEESRNE